MIQNDRRREAVEAINTAIERTLIRAGEIVVNEAKNLCPVDTGNLRNSIGRSDVHDNQIDVGTNVEYAINVELGTYKQGAQPYLGPALKGKQEAISAILKEEIARIT